MANKKGAQKGNNNGTKLKSPEIRQQAFLQYCSWLSAGMPKQAWSFKHPELTCCFKTMDKYIADNPLEFPALHMDIAKAEGYKEWINKGMSMMVGEVKNCQPAIYQMFMRNMFGWDKEKLEDKETKAALVDLLAKQWRESID